MAGESQTAGCRAGAAQGILCGAAILLVIGLFGCSPLDYLPPEELPYAKLAIPYSRTRLKTSVSLDAEILQKAISRGVHRALLGHSVGRVAYP